MADTVDRIITQSGNIFGIACNTTNLVGEAVKRHDMGPTGAAALGRAMTGAVLLAGLLKGEQSIQLSFEGNGPLGKITAEAGTAGWCRGFAAYPRADVPLKNGLIDVAGGIGKAGFLRVVKDIGMKDKYTGLVQLYTSEVGDDIAYYLTESEQTPSSIGIGVHLLPDGRVSAAGGFLIQSLPPADEEAILGLEKKIQQHTSITAMIAEGKTPGEILANLFSSIPHKHTGSSRLVFACKCTREKMVDALYTLNNDDIHYLMEEKDGVEVRCDFCNTRYTFSKDFLLTILAERGNTPTTDA